MKKLSILISFLVCFITSFAQYPVVNRSSAVNTVKDQRLMAGFNFYAPRYIDTVNANIAVNLGIDTCGALIFTYNTNGYWYRGCNPKRWIPIVSGEGGDVITIINDTSISICSFVQNVASLCDTFNITLINAIARVEIINDSTLLVCDTENNCDTLHIPPHNFNGIQARNFLNMNAPTTVEFGGNLIRSTTADTRSFVVNFNGATVYNYPYQFYNYQRFANGTGIASFRSGGGEAGQIDFANAVTLGINYTGAFYPASPNRTGYMGDKIGYLIGVNFTGHGSDGLTTSNSSSKLSGTLYHTLDTASTDAITFFGKHPPNATYVAPLSVGGLGLQPYRIMILKDNLDYQVPGYPNTRNDGLPTSRAFYADASGNVKYGPISAGSTVNIFNDTTLIICSNGNNLCDTTIINNVGNIQTVTILNDSTIIVCGDVPPCDTLVVPQADFDTGITASSGLYMVTPTNVRLGVNPLLANTTIPTSPFTLTINGSNSNGTLFVNNSANSSNAISGVVTGTGGTGVSGTSNTGSGGTFQSNSGIALVTSGASGAQLTAFSSATNTTIPVVTVNRTTPNTAANGIGGSIEFYNQTSNGSLPFTNSIRSILTDVTFASRTSQFILNGVNNAVTADLLTILGSGQTRLNNYGVGSFTAGTPAYVAAWDASGNFMETAVGASGLVYTADNGLTMTTNNVQLGGDLTVNGTTTITGGAATNEKLVFTGAPSSGTWVQVSSATTSNAFEGTSTGGGTGVYGSTTTSGTGVSGYSPSGTGISASSDSGNPLYVQRNTSTTNAVVRTAEFDTRTSGTAANGFGGSVDFYTETVSFNGRISNQIISKWTNPTDASRVSEFSITGVNNAVTATLLTIAGTGAQKWGGYGTGAITATAAFGLAVDATGNVIEIALGGGGGGTVNSVAGTLNRITSSGGTDPIIDISASYVGQASITTLGTIGTGVWQGTTIADDFGGTGLSTYTQGQILYASAANTLAALNLGTANQVLKVNAGGTQIEWGTLSGSGTVTVVTIGNLAPIFTASVANGSSTPAISFALTNAAANTWFGNNTGSAAAPSYNAFGTGVNAAISINVGSAGSIVVNGGALGTPSSGTLTNATGLPVSTGLSGLGTGVGIWLATPSSTNLAAAVTGETGTGALVFGTTPTLTTPVLGVATATSINKVILTAPATTATLTILNNKVFTVNKTITLDGTDNQTYTFPTTNATIARTDAGNTFTGNQVINGNVDFGNNLISKYGVTTSTQSGTSYTLVQNDNGSVIYFTNAGAVTVTLPSGFNAGYACTLVQVGAGQVTISTSGTTLNNFNGETKTGGQWAAVNIIYRTTNTYILTGETGP